MKLQSRWLQQNPNYVLKDTLKDAKVKKQLEEVLFKQGLENSSTLWCQSALPSSSFELLLLTLTERVC